jgi:hypothetical protein
MSHTFASLSPCSCVSPLFIQMHWKYRDDLDKQARNAYNFVKAASECLDTFLREPIPVELQRLLSMRRQLVEKKYPDEKKDKLGITFASEVLVLRLLGQVVTPEIENSVGGAFDPVKSTLVGCSSVARAAVVQHPTIVCVTHSVYRFVSHLSRVICSAACT